MLWKKKLISKKKNKPTEDLLLTQFDPVTHMPDFFKLAGNSSIAENSKLLNFITNYSQIITDYSDKNLLIYPVYSRMNHTIIAIITVKKLNTFIVELNILKDKAFNEIKPLSRFIKSNLKALTPTGTALMITCLASRKEFPAYIIQQAGFKGLAGKGNCLIYYLLT